MLLLPSIPPAGLVLINVSASNSHPVHNLDTGYNYTTIQEAINASQTSDGNRIRVDAGTYYEHLTVTKSISLIGEDRDATIIDGNGTGSVIKLKAYNINLVNFTVRNPGRTWMETPWNIDGCIQGSNLANANILIKRVVCIGGAASIWFDHSSGINVSDNIVSDGMYLGIGGYELQNVTIYDNVVQNIGSDAIHLDGGSRYCRVVNNKVTNSFDGITLETNDYSPWATSDNLIDGNIITNMIVASIGLFKCGTNVFRRNDMNGKQNNLVVWGYDSNAFLQDADASNTVNGRVLYYLTRQSGLLIDPNGYPNAGDIIVVDSTNLTIRDFDLTSQMDGILLAGSVSCSLINVTIGNNQEPMVYMGTPLIYGGITLFESSNNTVVDSTIHNNTYGVCLYHSDGNTFYHNMFVNIDRYVVTDYTSIFRNAPSGYTSKGAWDNGSEGNYWSNYAGTDANGDGTGDTPYVIDTYNQDNHPLSSPYWYWRNPMIFDLNRDMKVDRKDIDVAAKTYGSYPSHPLWNPRADITGPTPLVQDNKVDIRDLALIAKHYGETYPQ